MLNFLSALLFTILPACQFEDGNNCKWDATVQGNGVGASYFTILDQSFYVETL